MIGTSLFWTIDYFSNFDDIDILFYFILFLFFVFVFVLFFFKFKFEFEFKILRFDEFQFICCVLQTFVL